MMKLIAISCLILLLSILLANATETHRHAARRHAAAPAPASPVKVVDPAAPLATWTIDASRPTIRVSPDLFGVFFEEINHAGVGGLFYEQIQNSNFEDTRNIVDPWKSNSAMTVLATDATMPLNGHQPTSMVAITKMSNMQQMVQLTNPGFWGISTIGYETLAVTFYAYSEDITTLTVSLIDTMGMTIAAEKVSGINAMWKKFELTLSVGSMRTPNASFAFSYTVPANMGARINFDVVSAFPNNGWNGLSYIRPDLGQAVADMKPAFMRFPGGCYVEGDYLPNRFNWKNSLGSFADRAGHWNGVWHYWSEDGLGLFEYLSFIEKLTDAFGNPTRMIWVVNNGISHDQSIATADIMPYVQDALDSVEFAQGDISTHWGAIRANMGHPAPFNISYMAIGNEDCGKPDYMGNYQIFYNTLKSTYPEIQLISNCAPTDKALGGLPVQVWDYHIYTTAASLAAGHNTFDADVYHKNVTSKVFNSEYAVTTGAGRGNLGAAVAEAAWMTGLERNGDVVTTASYAPLFVNDHDQTWNPDAIVFNSAQSYGTPSYWNQLIWMNSFMGIRSGSVQYLSNTLTGSNLYASVTVGMSSMMANQLILVHKIVNDGTTAQDVTITINNLPANAKLNPQLDVTQLTGPSATAENSFANPRMMVPTMTTLMVTGPSFTASFPALSVTIVRAYATVA